MTINCKDGQSVKADKFILAYVPYFSSMLSFKNSQASFESAVISADVQALGEPTDLFCTDLSSFSATAVEYLVEFIYTGVISLPLSFTLQLEFYFLADYTTNDNLSKLLIDKLVTAERVLDVLLSLKGKSAHLKLRVRQFRGTVASVDGNKEKIAMLFEDEIDLDLIKELLS